jgi:hypothetical protein
MTRTARGLVALVMLLGLGAVASGAADDKGEMAENPLFKFWSGFKPGATSTYTQVTKYHEAEKAAFPGGVEKKTINYQLVNANGDRAVVRTVVVEEDFLSTIESAPTRITYPAKVKKANLDAFFQEWGVKEGEEETVKVGGKEIKCKVRSGTHKSEGAVVEFKICYSDAVPGGIVKRTRVTKDGDKVVAETTTTLVSFGEAKGAGEGKE